MEVQIRGSEQSVEEFLAARKAEREAWFTKPDDTLVVCVFTPTRELCRGGVLRTVAFQRAQGRLTTEALEEVCVD